MTAIERLRDAAALTMTEQERSECSTLPSHPAYADPIYRISKLASAARKPLFVSPDCTIQIEIGIAIGIEKK